MKRLSQIQQTELIKIIGQNVKTDQEALTALKSIGILPVVVNKDGEFAYGWYNKSTKTSYYTGSSYGPDEKQLWGEQEIQELVNWVENGSEDGWGLDDKKWEKAIRKL